MCKKELLPVNTVLDRKGNGLLSVKSNVAIVTYVSLQVTSISTTATDIDFEDITENCDADDFGDDLLPSSLEYGVHWWSRKAVQKKSKDDVFTYSDGTLSHLF